MAPKSPDTHFDARGGRRRGGDGEEKQEVSDGRTGLIELGGSNRFTLQKSKSERENCHMRD